MKIRLTIIAILACIMANAQEPQIIGGYLLDGKDSFEELDAAVVTDSKSKVKTLTGKGMKIPGPVVMMTPRNVGEEIGSMVKTKHPFLVKTISFPVDENRMEGCKASIRIYRKEDDGSLDNIVTMPISQDIPITKKKTEFVIAPEEILLLEPGEYYVSFSITEIEDEIMARWADADTWEEDERYTKYMQDRIFFPLYLKNSYRRRGPDKPLADWDANIGLSVKGIEK